MRHRALLALLVAAALAAARAHAGDAAALAAARDSLQAGVSRADASAILRARAAFLALAPEAADPAAIQCWVALCCWRAEPLVVDSDRERARKLCHDGIDAAERALALDPRFGEALALEASVQALSITFAPTATVSLGAQVQEELARADGMDPANPRIELLAAIFTLHKPAQYAGGPGRAKPLFEHALAHFGTKPGRHGMSWGHDDALLWSGRCLAQLGDWKAARERFRAALAANPDNRWVRDRLLPDAEQHAAAARDTTP